MDSKKDEPAKKDTAGAATPGSARPHATLDLKATVVEPKGSKEAPKAAAKEPAKEPAPDHAQDGAQDGAKDQKPAASATAASGAASAEAPKSEPASPPPSPPRPAASGRFFTHLAAGIMGGIVALLAADIFASQLGLGDTSEQADVSAALQKRIEKLEETSKGNGATSALTTRLKAAEAKLDKLARLPSTVADLEKEQGALLSDVKSLDAKVGAQGGDESTAARVTKLEDKLTALSDAAARDPQGGGLPQLAAVTGKITDLESTVKTQLDALRKNVSEEIDTRLSAATAASETAKSGTQRIDRELAGIKADNAQLAARINALTADSERVTQTLRTTQEEMSRLKVDLNAQLPSFAKPADVAAATAPLTDKLNALQQDVQGVVKGEEERKATAGRIVLSLELANLKRAIDRGRSYATELAAARKLSDGSIDLTPLSRFADTGVPTLAQLREDFKPVAFKIIDAEQQPADGSLVDRLLAGAKSVVRVRKISHESDDKSVEAIVGRMETALNEDRLDDVIEQAKTLPPAAQDAARDFVAKVEARNTVDRALTSVETQLKASLVAQPAAAATSGQ
jgi:hypothetical protein